MHGDGFHVGSAFAGVGRAELPRREAFSVIAYFFIRYCYKFSIGSVTRAAKCLSKSSEMCEALIRL